MAGLVRSQQSAKRFSPCPTGVQVASLAGCCWGRTVYVTKGDVAADGL